MWTTILRLITFIYLNELLGVIGKYLIYSIKYFYTYIYKEILIMQFFSIDNRLCSLFFYLISFAYSFACNKNDASNLVPLF